MKVRKLGSITRIYGSMNGVVIELKAAQTLVKEHEVQLVNYLTATKVDLGLLLNFGPSVQVKRKFREYKPKGSLLNAILPADSN